MAKLKGYLWQNCAIWHFFKNATNFGAKYHHKQSIWGDTEKWGKVWGKINTHPYSTQGMASTLPYPTNHYTKLIEE